MAAILDFCCNKWYMKEVHPANFRRQFALAEVCALISPCSCHSCSLHYIIHAGLLQRNMLTVSASLVVGGKQETVCLS